MRENILSNKRPEIKFTDTGGRIEPQVSKPLEYNKIYLGDSFELIERVPAKTVDLILEDMPCV